MGLSDEGPETEREADDAPIDPRVRRRRILLVLFALFALLIVAPVIWFLPYIHHQLTKKPPSPVAAYQGFTIRQEPEFRELVMTFEDEQPPAPVFVQLPDERKFPLLELPEEEAAKLLPKVPDRDPPTGNQEYSDARSFLTYRDGKLAFVVLHAQSNKFRVSGRAAGPFVSFPCDRAQLIAAFGEPLRWERPALGPPDQDPE